MGIYFCAFYRNFGKAKLLNNKLKSFVLNIYFVFTWTEMCINWSNFKGLNKTWGVGVDNVLKIIFIAEKWKNSIIFGGKKTKNSKFCAKISV